MCKLITIINKNPELNPLIARIIDENASSLATQSDGYSVYQGGETAFYPNFGDYANIKENIAYKGGEIYMVHSRIMTSGQRGIQGLHLQKIDGRFVYGHNGFVAEHSTTKEKSDSHFFFKDLIELGGPDKISENIDIAIMMTGFSGRGALYDEQEDRLYVFSGSASGTSYYSDMYVYGYKDALIFSSYSLRMETGEPETFRILGMVYTAPTATSLTAPLIELVESDKLYVFHKGEVVEYRDLDLMWGVEPVEPEPVEDKKSTGYSFCYTCVHLKSACTCPEKKHDLKQLVS